MVHCLMLLFLSQMTFAGFNYPEWSPNSDPLIMGENFETRLEYLPLMGQVNIPKKLWSGDFWPLNKGMINFRWNASSDFYYSSPTKQMAKAMKQAEVAQLSPAEKFDLLNGRYHYPLQSEVEGHIDYSAKKWEGICHGWAPASMNHNEPTPKMLQNPDGISIPFASADIKALLSYYYAYPYQVENTHQIGRRCYKDMLNFSKDCKQDLNAGAFHIILTNKIGLRNETFIGEMDRYKEVWNHPLLGYEMTMEKFEGSSKVKVKVDLAYIYASKNAWGPQNGTDQQIIKHLKVKYLLELDSEGRIIGGKWKSLERPDFLWTKARPKKFSGDYARLAELLND